MFELGAGFIAKHRWQRSQGYQFDVDNLSIEDISAHWGDVVQFDKGMINPTSTDPIMEIVFKMAEERAERKEKAAQ